MDNKLEEKSEFEENSNPLEYDDVEMEPIELSNSAEKEGSTNEILAEMCFMEAEDLFSRGDRSGAISSYKQAYNYLPRKINYCLKLIDLLLEDQNSYKEAEQILNKALELNPDNLELNIRLNQLRNKSSKTKPLVNKDVQTFLQQTEITTQKIFKEDIKAAVKEIGLDFEKSKSATNSNKTNDVDTVAMLKELDELEAKSSSTAPLTSSLTKKSPAKETKSENSVKSSTIKAPSSNENDTAAMLKELDELEAKSSLTTPLTTPLTKKSSAKEIKSEDSAKVTKILGSNENDTAAMLKELDQMETKSSAPAQKTTTTKKSSETSQDSNTRTLTTEKVEKSQKGERGKFVKGKFVNTAPDKLPNKFATGKLLAVLLVFLLAISGLAYKLFSKPTIILLDPVEKSFSDVKDIKFQWSCSKPKTLFLLEIYEDEKFVIKEFTKETYYTPSAEQMSLFSPEHKYRWRVLLPLGFSGDYSFASDIKTFSISKTAETVTKPEEQQTNQDKPQQFSPPPVQPIPNFQRKKQESGKGEY